MNLEKSSFHALHHQRREEVKMAKKLIVLQFHTTDNHMIFPFIMSYFLSNSHTIISYQSREEIQPKKKKLLPEIRDTEHKD